MYPCDQIIFVVLNTAELWHSSVLATYAIYALMVKRLAQRSKKLWPLTVHTD